jgi:hypothetical protein
VLGSWTYYLTKSYKFISLLTAVVFFFKETKLVAWLKAVGMAFYFASLGVVGIIT